MRRRFSRKRLWVAALLPVLALGCAGRESLEGTPKDLPILQRWTGDLPLEEFDRLPAGQRQSRIGYLGDEAGLTRLWQALKPQTAVPTIDFSKNLVVFARNVDFYHRLLIAKVTLTVGVAEIIAVGTAAVSPLEDRVAMALAVIPREGLEFIQRGKERISVR